MSAALEVRGLSHCYGKEQVLRDVHFEVRRGEFAALLGASGSGKTTILRAIAGFESVQSGSILIDGKDVTLLPPEKRKVGVVFQDLALFVHLSVAGNVGFGIRHLPGEKKRQKIHDMLELVGLPGFEKRAIHELSGGQKQRVALARALATDPSLLLLDEPFSSLDQELRLKLREEISALLHAVKASVLLVTHDPEEAFDMADSIGILAHGQLLQWGSGPELFQAAVNPVVARFLGDANFLTAEVSGLQPPRARCALGEIEVLFPSGQPLSPGQRGQVLIRPHDIEIRRGSGSANAQLWTVERIQFRGTHFLHQLSQNGAVLTVEMNANESFAPGDQVQVRLRPEQLALYPF